MLAMAIIIILWVLGPHAKEEVLLNEIELKLKAEMGLWSSINMGQINVRHLRKEYKLHAKWNVPS